MPNPTPTLQRLAAYAAEQEPTVTQNARIDQTLYQTYGVKCGLRDQNGKGVLAGLTRISEIQASKEIDGVSVPCASASRMAR